MNAHKKTQKHQRHQHISDDDDSISPNDSISVVNSNITDQSRQIQLLERINELQKENYETKLRNMKLENILRRLEYGLEQTSQKFKHSA